jgi:hypothetical protein
MVGEGDAPVVAVLLTSAKADEPIAAPKGRGPRTLAALPLQTSHFKGPPEGATIAFLDPWARRPRSGAETSYDRLAQRIIQHLKLRPGEPFTTFQVR